MKNILDGDQWNKDQSAVETLAPSRVFPFSAVQRAFFSYAHDHNRPVAAWQLPQQTQQHLIADLCGSGQLPLLPLELLPAGFIAHPFREQEAAAFIRADVHYTSEAQSTDNAVQKALRLVEKYLVPDERKRTPYAVSPAPTTPATEHRSFVDTVAEAVRAIEAGRFHKVVPSRQKMILLPADFDVTEAFQRLCAAYPAAFVSAFSIPGVGTWLGASPETLVSTYQQAGRSVFRTMALAGTQVAQGQNALKQASWRQKEIEEQAMVSRYIINCFKKIRLRDFEENGPKTVAAGNLLHLRTDFTVDTEKTNFSDLGSTMLRLLHPTSAVCGMPKEPALDFLREREGYDRSFFSGYLGPVNVAEETHVFVNLRCAQLLKQRAVFYAGAGVTADSEPEQEWAETEMKMDTLLRVII